MDPAQISIKSCLHPCSQIYSKSLLQNKMSHSLLLYPSSTVTSSLPPKFHLSKLKFHPLVIGIVRNQTQLLKNITTIRSQMDDGYYMRRSVELARTAIGHTSPNPMVGCVIVNENGEIVGEGFHPKAGQPHAEVFALRNAANLAENATAYVSLEPCNHYGRTPPCTEALIKEKVKRVVVGMVDPNPIVASKGVEKLRASGISVTVGVEEEMCRKLNEAYIHRMLTGKPFLTIRYTLSIDGNILNHPGEGSEELGGYYSELLQEYDGIISSSNFLSVPISQEIGAKQPVQIIIAKGQTSSLSLPNLLPNSSSHVIVFAENSIDIEPKFEGLEVVVLEKLSLRSILDYCGKLGLCSILMDIRGDYIELVDLLGDCFSENLVQKVVIELCTDLSCKEELTNTNSGKTSFIRKIANGDPRLLRLKDLNSRVSNNSVLVEGYI